MPSMHPEMSDWTRADRDRLDFARWLVVRGKLTDGESERDMLAERKFAHKFPPFLRRWTREMVSAHEGKRR